MSTERAPDQALLPVHIDQQVPDSAHAKIQMRASEKRQTPSDTVELSTSHGSLAEKLPLASHRSCRSCQSRTPPMPKNTPLFEKRVTHALLRRGHFCRSLPLVLALLLTSSYAHRTSVPSSFSFTGYGHGCRPEEPSVFRVEALKGNKYV